MLTAEITGDSHPKTVTIVSDDKNAENATIIDKLREQDWWDLADRFQAAPLDEAGLLKVKLETDEIGEFIDFLEAEFITSDAYHDLEAMRVEAVAEAQKRLGGE